MQVPAFEGRVYPPVDPDDLSRGYATPDCPCPHCGSLKFDPPPADEDTIIRCDDCGAEAPWLKFFGHDKPK